MGNKCYNYQINNQYNLKEVYNSVLSKWGDFELLLLNVPILKCGNEQVFDMRVSRFMQLLTKFFSEKDTDINKLDISNLKEYFYDRENQNKFIEALTIDSLIKKEDIYYIKIK